MLLKPCKTGHHLICNPSISRVQNTVALTIKLMKDCSWKNLVVGWIPTIHQQTAFWQTICRLHQKSFKYHNHHQGFDWEYCKRLEENPFTIKGI